MSIWRSGLEWEGMRRFYLNEIWIWFPKEDIFPREFVFAFDCTEMFGSVFS